MLDPLSVSIESPTLLLRPSYPQRKLLQPSPDSPDDYVLELDYSSLSNFLSCPRRSENYSIRSREANKPSSATEFGKLFHECEELRLRHGWSDDTKAKQHQLVETHFLSHPPSPSDHRTADRMVAILARYNKIYNETTPDHWHDKILYGLVEVPFKVPICTIPVESFIPYSAEQLTTNGDRVMQEMSFPKEGGVKKSFFVSRLHIIYTGRIDAILSDSNLLWVVDHKTSSRGGSEFVEAFRLSRQTLGYVWAAQKLLDKPIAGLIMNGVVVKPPTQKVYENTEYTRHSFFYSQDHLVEWEESMRYTLLDFVECLRRGYFPQAARSFKSPCCGCDYQENCTLPPSQRGADLASELYRDVCWNPMH